MTWSPCLIRHQRPDGPLLALGHPLLVDYLEFVVARSVRTIRTACSFPPGCSDAAWPFPTILCTTWFLLDFQA
jgi:hypothetical protein